MKKISRRSFMAAAAVSVAALAMTACGGSASSAASSVASSAASSEAVSSAAAAELTTVEAGKLTMATNATFPPYEMTTDSGEIEGIDVDTAKAIAEKLGLELQIDDMDFDAALLSVQQGKADIVMAGVTVTDERKAVMDFSDSYATGIQSIIVPNDSDIASPDDLAGKKIGTQRGTTLRESQAVKLIAKVLGAMMKFSAVLLPLPLGEVDANVVSRRRGRRTARAEGVYTAYIHIFSPLLHKCLQNRENRDYCVPKRSVEEIARSV